MPSDRESQTTEPDWTSWDWEWTEQMAEHKTTRRSRIPAKDDPFFIINAGRMFLLLVGVDHHPAGCPINEALRLEIQKLCCEAYEGGIDTIGVSECGLLEYPDRQEPMAESHTTDDTNDEIVT